MTLLTTLGIGSMLFVVAFTAYNARRGNGVGQSPRSAIIEAWVNIVIGFSINFVVNMMVIPLAIEGPCHIPAVNNWWMGWVFTTISIVRQYAIRRWFNDRLHRAALRLAGGH